VSLFYLLPPAGTPVTFGEILRAWLRRADLSGDRSPFRDQLRAYTGARTVELVSNGRTAQYLLLKGVGKLAGAAKTEVIIPAYTCFSVAASVARAGLRMRLVDVDPATLDYRYDLLQKVDTSSVAALSACNLFGLISNWDTLLAFGRERGLFLIDDAAQTLGSQSDGRLSGTFGDAGFYSFDRGKNLSTYSGGAIITSDDRLAGLVADALKEVPPPGTLAELSVLVKLLLYGLFLRPRCFWFPNLLPFLGLGETVYDPAFDVGRPTRLQQALGDLMFERLTAVNQRRRENGRRLAREILSLGPYEIPGFVEHACPIYLRLPVLAKDRETRDRLVARLRRAGIVASTMYPSTIADIAELGPLLANPQEAFPGARRIVDCLLTLPTHPYVRDRDLVKIVSCLKAT
jgi:perosamine synthetase